MPALFAAPERVPDRRAANYSFVAASADFTILAAGSTVTVICPVGPYTYSGLAQEPVLGQLDEHRRRRHDGRPAGQLPEQRQRRSGDRLGELRR